MEKRHIISILVENKFGVLARVAGLFSGRGYNIESLTVNSTDKHDVSMMTIVTNGDDKIIEQIIKQLRKLLIHQKEKLVLLGKIPKETLTLYIWVRQALAISRRLVRKQVMNIDNILVRRFHEIYASNLVLNIQVNHLSNN